MPANSPDFNPIERIWALMKKKKRIFNTRERCGENYYCLREVIKRRVGENHNLVRLIKRLIWLPTVMARCIEAGGSNNYNS